VEATKKISYYSMSDVSNNCYAHCGSGTTYAYYGIRIVGNYTYLCGCIARDISQIAGGLDYSQQWTGDPSTHYKCGSWYIILFPSHTTYLFTTQGGSIGLIFLYLYYS
jgi:hypothetical protein